MDANAWDRLATALFPENLFADDTRVVSETTIPARPQDDVLERLRQRIAAENAGLKVIEAAIGGMGA